MMHHRTPRQSKRIVTEIVMLLALIAVILVPGIPAANAQTAQPQATIVADVLNVRGGPGTAYAVVGQAKAGQTYPITGKSADGKWLVIDSGREAGLGSRPIREGQRRARWTRRREGACGAQSRGQACRRAPTCAARILRLRHPDRSGSRSRRGHRRDQGVGLQLGEVPIAVEGFRGRRSRRAQLARRRRR